MKSYILDTTLRDGEQAPGVMFSLSQKMIIAEKLDQLGIDEVEVGTPAMGNTEIKTIRAIAESGFDFKTSAWARALKQDIDASSKAKTDAVSISFPVSSIQLEALGKTPLWLETEMPRLVNYARAYFDRVYVGFQDATRCDIPHLERYVALAQSCAVDRIRIADTVGIMNPISTQKLFVLLTKLAPAMDFEFHTHNDLGMATANAFMALQSGAMGISATVNGLGERAGNTALEEIIMAIRLDEKETRYNTYGLKELCDYVAMAARQDMALSKPIVGKHTFTHETGIHVKSLLKNKMTYQAFDESLVGHQSNTIIIGKHSGRHAIADFYQKQGYALLSSEVDVLYNYIQTKIQAEGKVLRETELLACYHSLFGV